MKKIAMAIACHPDDIEFSMAGTLLQLQKRGWEVHYMDVANGSLGTAVDDYQTIVAKRRGEAKAAAESAGMIFHESICDDIEVFYTYELLAKLVPVVRAVEPTIVLTHGPWDYMEDHINTGRLAVSALFCRGMQNMKCAPTSGPTFQDVALYHAMPHGLIDQLRRPVIPEILVDVEPFMERKKAMLRSHVSQDKWLELSQGGGAYVQDMVRRNEQCAKAFGNFRYAEGWVRHNPLGFSTDRFNPLVEALSDCSFCNE